MPEEKFSYKCCNQLKEMLLEENVLGCCGLGTMISGFGVEPPGGADGRGVGISCGSGLYVPYPGMSQVIDGQHCPGTFTDLQ